MKSQLTRPLPPPNKRIHIAYHHQVPFEPASLAAVTVSSGDALAFAGDVLVVAVTEEDLTVKGERERVDACQRRLTAACNC